MEKRSVNIIRGELEALRAQELPTTESGIEARRECEHYLECELARAEGRAEPQWTHKGVL